jgi:hypothetical protein
MEMFRQCGNFVFHYVVNCLKLYAVALEWPFFKVKEECNIRVIPGTHHAHNRTLTILRFVATSLLL